MESKNTPFSSVDCARVQTIFHCFDLATTEYQSGNNDMYAGDLRRRLSFTWRTGVEFKKTPELYWREIKFQCVYSKRSFILLSSITPE